MTSVQEFIVRVGERTHTVRVEGDRAVVDGVGLTVVASPGGRSVVREEAGHGQRAVVLDGRATPEAASVGGVASKVELRTAQEAALAAAIGSGRAGGAAGSQLKAPMPGRVVRVLVAAGHTVERGAAVMIVEAMKMENELFAERDGSVAKVFVTPGTNVEGGAKLIEIRA